MQQFNNVNSITRMILAQKLSQGDRFVDATLGNGNDFEYMLRLVGDDGFGYGFDIQKQAIDATLDRLNSSSLSVGNVMLVQDGHENVDDYVSGSIMAAVFNLGYLPRGDHSVVTRPDTTVAAVSKLCGMLEQGGVIIIASYRSHDGGMEENCAVSDFLRSLDQSLFNVLRMDFINQKNTPPELFVIEKRG